MTRYLMVVTQISEALPHNVMVNRRTIESAAPMDELYAATETEAKSLVRDGFQLSNWHLFKADLPDEDTGFTLSSGRSASMLATK